MWMKTLIAGGMLGMAILSGCDRDQASAATATAGESAVVKGERAYAQTCAACHGVNGQGMPNQGANLKVSPYIAGHSDEQLVEFIKAGRQPTDPSTVMRLAMPPNGGNPSLTPAQLQQIVLYLRQVQREGGMMQTAGALPQQ